MRYLITGGAGFIGSHVVDGLTMRGDSVLVLDDFSTGDRRNLEHALSSNLVEVVEGSVLDEKLVDGCMDAVDACLHLASAVGVQLVVSRPLDTLRRSIHGTDTVISSAARQRRPLMFTSTSEIYGKQSDGAVREDADRVLGPPDKLRWSYATAKSFGEALVYSYVREHGCWMTVVRLFNTVGPRQTGAYGMVLPRFVAQALAGEPLTAYGDGRQRRCFCHVGDVVAALLGLLDDRRAEGEVFNVGSTEEVEIWELAERVVKAAGSSSEIRLVPYDEAYPGGFEDMRRRIPDISRIRNLIGWDPKRSLDEIIAELIVEARERT
jgi:nucleoside-diphosphate-sugar epimerase